MFQRQKINTIANVCFWTGYLQKPPTNQAWNDFYFQKVKWFCLVIFAVRKVRHSSPVLTEQFAFVRNEYEQITNHAIFKLQK